MREQLKTELICFLNTANEDERYKCNLKNVNEDESVLIFAINQINATYYCFSPDEIPYTGYDKEQFECIESELSFIANNLSNLKNKWKIYDFLWIEFKNYPVALQAFKGFVDLISTTDEYEKIYYIFNRCANLYMCLKQRELKYDFIRTLHRMIELGKNNENAQSINILETAYEKQWLTAFELISPITEKLTQYKSIAKNYLCIELMSLLEKALFDANDIKFTESPSKIKEITRLRREKADFYLTIANNRQESIFRRIDNIKLALETLRGINNTENERRILQGRLKELQGEFSKSLTIFSKSIDISNVIETIKFDISKLNEIEIFYYFVLSTKIFSYEKAEQEMIETDRGFISKQIFTEHILNKHGGLEAIMPNWSKAVKDKNPTYILPHVEKFCCERYRMYTNMSMTYIFSEIKTMNIDYKEEVHKIVNSSLFISNNRKQAFFTGIIAGFEEDFMTAISILVPQVEGAVRDLCLSCGDATVKIKQDKTEEYLSLDGLLKLPKINECVDEMILFNIKMLFTSVYGFNMRNRIAHGVMEDEDFKLIDCFFIWWFVLRLCLDFSIIKIEFSKKINAKLQ